MGTRSLAGVASLLITVSIAVTSAAQSDNKLHQAAEKGDLDQLRLALSQTTDLNQKDQRGYTALMAAASMGQVQAMEIIIERGADMNVQDPSGSTALHLARAGGQSSAVTLLLAKGADINLRNRSGLLPLDIAQSSQSTEIGTILERDLQSGAALQTAQDPNRVWRAVAFSAIQDSNQVRARVAAFKDLQQTVDELAKSGQNEQRVWVMRNPAQKTRLAKSLQQQVKAELTFLQGAAASENAKKTLADANGLQLLWNQRLDYVSDRLREARRLEMAQAAGRQYQQPPRPQAPANPPSKPNLGSPRDPNLAKGYFAPTRLKADQERLAGLWTATGTDNTSQIATDVNDIMLRDLGYLRTTAQAEKASEKTLAAIDAVIVLRAERNGAVVADLQSQNSALSTLPGGPPGTGPMMGQPGRRGRLQPGQQQGSGGYRSNRRGR